MPDERPGLEKDHDLRNDTDGFQHKGLWSQAGPLSFSCSSSDPRGVLVMTDTDWERVARLVRQRRTSLGLKQKGTPGVSAAVWSKIENGAAISYKPFILANIERTLRWPPGTIHRIGAGEDPPDDRPDVVERMDSMDERLRRVEAAVDRLARRLGD